MDLKFIKLLVLFFFFYSFLFISSYSLFAQSSGSINLSSESSNSKFAPGEFIPFSIKLLNFGSLQRGDVTLEYHIINSNKVDVSSSNETVAVDTTASFVKRIPLPLSLKPGNYTLTTSLTYPGQKQPAVSQFNFVVENKIAGLFQSDLIILFIIIVIIISVLLFILYLFIKRNRSRAQVSFDYSDVPKNQIIYYEILSNIINQMRLRIGDSAFEITEGIPDLEVNSKNGKIINIKKEPAKIIALLIFRFEKFSGQKISFGLQPNLK